MKIRILWAYNNYTVQKWELYCLLQRGKTDNVRVRKLQARDELKHWAAILLLDSRKIR
jgi:hypothetical protein